MIFRSKEEYDAEVAAHAVEVVEARERMSELVAEIQARTSPQNLMNEAVDTLSAKSALAVETARRRLQQHPYTIGAAAAAVGLFAVGRLRSKDEERSVP
ncbi:DUF3618 domain-containing protein [Pacificimonas flava]|uniref:DUF883 domain-containing protein n=1 Tax=Pacificimonas flava TaxID=1234595 RepID=M2U3P6_9SPHN|nr:DUF3618 domain-containing protein [Pacificimonas flava]EMD82662.1 hypothetical protein C725_2049 [Pacificimonas flava]MBB5281487.1 ElaB/YqjD/DUF883 family membrane-anchored ribosome-binding protein [Pacificimonas flava]